MRSRLMVAVLASAISAVLMSGCGKDEPAPPPAPAAEPVAFAPATAMLTPVPVPTIALGPRLAYLDLGLTLF